MSTAPQKNVPSFRTLADVTIANNESLSDGVKLYGNTLIGIIMPASWTAAVLSFQGSVDGGTTYYDLYDSTGTEKTVATVGTSRIIMLPPQDWFAIDAIKVRSGTTGSAVNQGGARTIQLILAG